MRTRRRKEDKANQIGQQGTDVFFIVLQFVETDDFLIRIVHHVPVSADGIMLAAYGEAESGKA